MPLQFEEPPSRVGSWSYDWIAVLREIKARPGEWAVLDRQIKLSIANALREGKIRMMAPKFGVQVQVRNSTRNSPRVGDVFIRYWPENDKTLTAPERRDLMKKIEKENKG